MLRSTSCANTSARPIGREVIANSAITSPASRKRSLRPISRIEASDMAGMTSGVYIIIGN